MVIEVEKGLSLFTLSRETGDLSGKGQERTILGDGNGFFFVLSGGYTEYTIIRSHLSNAIGICILLYINYPSTNSFLSKKSSVVEV